MTTKFSEPMLATPAHHSDGIEQPVGRAGDAPGLTPTRDLVSSSSDVCELPVEHKESSMNDQAIAEQKLPAASGCQGVGESPMTVAEATPAAVGADEQAATRKPGSEAEIFAKLGEPFVVEPETGKVELNQLAVATAFTHTQTIEYDSVLRQFFRYDAEQGLWVPESAERTHQEMAMYLVALGERRQHQQFVKRQKEGTINSLLKFAKANDVKPARTETGGFFHAANGVLDLKNDLPVLRPHSRDFPFRKSSRVTYDPKAQCPRFLTELLEPALNADDRQLLQTCFGGMLLGENQAQKILLIRGTAGGGKSILVSTIEKILGEHKIAYLRAKQLNGRFETAGFIGRSVLVGKDVPGDTLSENGARMLKSLTGGDLLEGEIKGQQHRPQMKGFYHVVIVSNNHLRIKLDGDEQAWGRRLIILEFHREMPKKAIVNFADELVADEGSGILNWLVVGAARYRSQLADGTGRIVMTAAQKQRVDNLLGNSDNVRAFVDRHLQTTPGQDMSSDELVSAYVTTCQAHGWQPVPTRKFQQTVGDELMSRHNIHQRHDILRPGRKPVRGFKGIAVI